MHVSDTADTGQQSPTSTETPRARTLRIVLAVAVATLCAIAASQITLQNAAYPSVFLLLLTQAVIVLTALQAVRRRSVRERILPLAIATFSVVYATLATTGILLGGSSMMSLLFSAVSLAAVTMLPWGYRPQLLHVSSTGLALLANVYLLATFDPPGWIVVANVALIGIALLAAVFIAARIQSYREQLVSEHLELESTRKLIRSLDEQLETRVSERTADLEATNRDLETFSYSVSHDLHGPLRTVSGFAESLMEDYGDQLGPDALDQVRRVHAGTQRMRELVDGLLELSRLGRAELVREDADLSDAARLVVAELESGSPQREVEITIPDGIRAYADPRQVQSLIDNLVGNAWKFTAGRKPARIEIGTVAVDGRPAYFVRDNGVGFDMDDHDRLFSAFERSERAASIGGLGIGLATASRIVARHGGRIWAESEPDHGATFYFTLSAPPEEDETA